MLRWIEDEISTEDLSIRSVNKLEMPRSSPLLLLDSAISVYQSTNLAVNTFNADNPGVPQIDLSGGYSLSMRISSQLLRIDSQVLLNAVILTYCAKASPSNQTVVRSRELYSEDLKCRRSQLRARRGEQKF